MKIKNVLVFCFGLMLFVSLVSAVTTVHVKTLPRQDFYLTPIAVGEGFTALNPPQFYSSDEYGDLTIELENISVSKFSLFVSLKDEAGTTTFRKKFNETFITGTEFNITVAPEGATLLQTPSQIVYPELVANLTTSNLTNLSTNVTANITSNKTNNSNEVPIVPVKKVRKSKINDSLISGEITNNSGTIFNLNTLWYIIGAVVLLGIVIFLFLGRKSHKGLSPYARGIESHYQNELNKAKKEFKHAKDKLDLLKGKKDILAVEKKIETDRKQLEELLAKENKKFK